ncbi:dipeptidase [Sphingomonas colocasiae]|uniref:Dipeptidase n=1 Tax=Sphingomonas colocasiae TaxID=1848973 RepID=A0ABS7PWL2_9SPHN|nr:membrane dipeptidase [Sphingomonas colocasiae]MBY8825746.1 dipeptidase [Sphingomonas colocasiae]
MVRARRFTTARALAASLAALALTGPSGAAEPFTLDAHIDIEPGFDAPASPATAEGATQFDLAKARRGGLDAAILAVFAPQETDTPGARTRARAIAEAKHAAIVGLAVHHPDRVGLARSPAEARAIAASGRFAVVEGIVNGGAFVGTLDDIDDWAKRGVAFFGFVHAGHNGLADSSRPALVRGEPQALNQGLSPLGREAIGRLNRLGVVIDISQLSDQAVDQALALSRAPVIASHSAVRGLVGNGRNLTDAQLDALKANGGVIAINAFSAYLRPHDAGVERQFAALKTEFGLSDAGGAALPAARAAEYTKRYYAIRATEPKADVDRLVDAIDYAVKRIGIDHVALSSDFNHGGGVTGWQDAGETGNVTAALARRGYSAADIEKLWSGNVLRIWQAARDGGAQLAAR